MSEIKSNDQVVWLDLETSGLSPKDDVIMEIGVLIPEWFPTVVVWSSGRARFTTTLKTCA